MQSYIAWIIDFWDTYICTLRIKNNKNEDCIHKYNRSFHKEKKMI